MDLKVYISSEFKMNQKKFDFKNLPRSSLFFQIEIKQKKVFWLSKYQNFDFTFIFRLFVE